MRRRLPGQKRDTKLVAYVGKDVSAWLKRSAEKSCVTVSALVQDILEHAASTNERWEVM